MFTDSFFRQGVSHTVCEDYASRGEDFAVVSDGCSSGDDTDWGSRVVCKLTERNLHLLRGPDRSVGEFLRALTSDMKSLNDIWLHLSSDSMLATLGLLYTDGPVVRCLLVGDGVIGARRKDGVWEYATHEQPRGGCFYPYYLAEDGWAETYRSQFGGGLEINDFVGFEGEEKPRTSDDRCQRDYQEAEWTTDGHDFWFVGSDGWMSFTERVNTGTSKYTQKVATGSALSVFLGDEECRRRLGMENYQRLAFKEYAAKNWQNHDDVSMAVIDRGSP